MTTIRERNNIKSVVQHVVVDLDLLAYLATEGRQRKEILEAVASLRSSKAFRDHPALDYSESYARPDNGRVLRLVDRDARNGRDAPAHAGEGGVADGCSAGLVESGGPRCGRDQGNHGGTNVH